MIKKTTPWFDKNGKIKPTFIIKAGARKWDAETLSRYKDFLLDNQITVQALWEIYLQKFERYQREEYILPEVV